MRVEKSNEKIAFESFRLDQYGRSALRKYVSGTSPDATGEVAKTLNLFKNRMDEFASKLDKRGIDIVLTTKANDDTGWRDIPALIFKKGKKTILEPLYLKQFIPNDEKLNEIIVDNDKLIGATEILIRFEDSMQKITSWFNENYEKVLDITKASSKRAHSRNDIISDIFGKR